MERLGLFEAYKLYTHSFGLGITTTIICSSYAYKTIVTLFIIMLVKSAIPGTTNLCLHALNRTIDRLEF